MESQNYQKFSRRQLRGLEIVARGGQIINVNDGIFKVKSQSSNKTYNVVWVANRRTCSCADFAKRLRDCKHVYAVQFYLTSGPNSRINESAAVAKAQ